MKKNTPFQRGFTVIELLLVAGIIAIIVSLLFPALGVLGASRNASRCMNNLRQQAHAVGVYTTEHNGTLPPFRKDDLNWYIYLWYRNGKSPSPGVLPNENPANDKEHLTVYQCPANPGRITRWNTPNYAYNRAIGESRIANIDIPARVILLVDAGYRVDSAQSPTIGPESIVCYTTECRGASYYWERSLDFKGHKGRCHIVFLDGHIESLTARDVEKRIGEKAIFWSRNNEPVNDARRTNYW